MKLDFEVDYPADPDRVMRLMTDQSFVDECERELGSTEHRLDVTRRDGLVVVRLQRHVPTDGIPAVFRSLVGPQIVVVEVRDWAADSLGGYRGTLVADADAKGRRARIEGRVQLLANGGGSHFQVDVEVEASVPLVGKQVRRAIVELATESLHLESVVMKRRLQAALTG